MPATTEFEHQLARLFRASRYAERMCQAHPTLIDKLRASSAERLHLPAIAPSLDEAECHANLRRRRHEAVVKLIFRDINGMVDLGEVVDVVSNLATDSVRVAVQFHTAALAAKWRVPNLATEQAQLVVVGMGKLGGAELNVSSDIDLIFVHDEDGEAAKDRSWHEFHSELGKRVIRALDAVDENGFVFRVDMRLRPFGASGPLVASLASVENYFYTQARAWERYAWLKAQALTGHHSTVHALESMVRPFVYRRYSDYSAIEEMRELHDQIRSEAAKRNRLDDIKIGVGGIREVEFIAQLFQLIRGGREPALQTRSTRVAFDALAKFGLLAPHRVDALKAAYAFLRNLEHRLQYVDDQQTQLLPTDSDDRQRIAEAMGFSDWATFHAVLQTHRDVVTQEFESLFAPQQASPSALQPNTSGAGGAGAVAEPQPKDPTSEVRAIASARGLNAAATEAIVQRISNWLSAGRTQTLGVKSRSRMETLIPKVLAATLDQCKDGNAHLTFFRVWDMIEAIDKRETYLALLIEYPTVLARVCKIAYRSAWAADFLKRHPILLDELIDNRLREAQIDWQAEEQALQHLCDEANGDIERQYEILRHAKQVLTLRLNIADIEGRISTMALSDELTALADLLLNTTLVLAARALKLLGSQGGWTPPQGFGVIGYGKLGSKELGYASDLDIVFVFDEKSSTSSEQFARLAQRVNSWLNTMTSGGVLYETDLRLRPDGDAGRMACNLTALRDYQLTRAWTWEHQALTRARYSAGDPALSVTVQAIRDSTLAIARDREKLKQDILSMRNKMRAEKKDRSGQRDLKNTVGGMVDIEFIVQYIILAYAHEHPELLGNLGNFALLARAAALGILDESAATALGHAYLAYRERQHLARNSNETTTWIDDDALTAERLAVTQVWARLFST